MTSLAVGGCSGSGSGDAAFAAKETPAIVSSAIRSAVEGTQTGGRAVAAVNVVERFGGRDTRSGFLVPSSAKPLIDSDARAAVEAALAPRQVQWVPDLAGSTDGPMTTVSAGSPAVRLTVILAEPAVRSSRATVAVETRCGRGCHQGTVAVLTRDAKGSWSVTGTEGGFIE